MTKRTGARQPGKRSWGRICREARKAANTSGGEKASPARLMGSDVAPQESALPARQY